MKIYTVHLSEDGLMSMCATNVKALYKIIELSGYKVKSIDYYDRSINKHLSKPYTYNNLVSTLKISTYNNTLLAWVDLVCIDAMVHIKELEIISK